MDKQEFIQDELHKVLNFTIELLIETRRMSGNNKTAYLNLHQDRIVDDASNMIEKTILSDDIETMDFDDEDDLSKYLTTMSVRQFLDYLNKIGLIKLTYDEIHETKFASRIAFIYRHQELDFNTVVNDQVYHFIEDTVDKILDFLVHYNYAKFSRHKYVDTKQIVQMVVELPEYHDKIKQPFISTKSTKNVKKNNEEFIIDIILTVLRYVTSSVYFLYGVSDTQAIDNPLVIEDLVARIIDPRARIRSPRLTSSPEYNDLLVDQQDDLRKSQLEEYFGMIYYWLPDDENIYQFKDGQTDYERVNSTNPTKYSDMLSEMNDIENDIKRGRTDDEDDEHISNLTVKRRR